MKVEAESEIDALQLYDKQDVARRAKRSTWSVDADEKRDDCPLKWSKHGRKCYVDAATLRRYLEWLVDQGRKSRAS